MKQNWCFIIIIIIIVIVLLLSLITKQKNEASFEGEFQLFPLAANSRRQLE